MSPAARMLVWDCEPGMRFEILPHEDNYVYHIDWQVDQLRQWPISHLNGFRSEWMYQTFIIGASHMVFGNRSPIGTSTWRCVDLHQRHGQIRGNLPNRQCYQMNIPTRCLVITLPHPWLRGQLNRGHRKATDADVTSISETYSSVSAPGRKTHARDTHPLQTMYSNDQPTFWPGPVP